MVPLSLFFKDFVCLLGCNHGISFLFLVKRILSKAYPIWQHNTFILRTGNVEKPIEYLILVLVLAYVGINNGAPGITNTHFLKSIFSYFFFAVFQILFRQYSRCDCRIEVLLAKKLVEYYTSITKKYLLFKYSGSKSREKEILFKWT